MKTIFKSVVKSFKVYQHLTGGNSIVVLVLEIQSAGKHGVSYLYWYQKGREVEFC
jgi:hypothetical protein